MEPGGGLHDEAGLDIEVLPLSDFAACPDTSPGRFLAGLQLNLPGGDTLPHLDCFDSPGGILDSEEGLAFSAEVEKHEALRQQVAQQQLSDTALAEDLHFLDELFPQPPQVSVCTCQARSHWRSGARTHAPCYLLSSSLLSLGDRP